MDREITYSERRDLLKEARAMASLPYTRKRVREPAVIRHARARVARYDRLMEEADTKRRRDHDAVYADVRYVLMVTVHRDEAVKMLRKLRASHSAGR